MRRAVLALCAFLVLCACLAATPVLAQSMPGMGGADTPETRANADAMKAMNHAMMAPATGNADQDFVAMMLPHHQGAVDMAKIELQYGHDAQLKRLARAIVAAQEKEIAFMRAWQAKHPAAAH
jgi:uncharacterized protein (DUF305 family)